ncbi:MAG: MBL fold metallo-hydrolase [Gaiellales bacterium]
MTVLGSSGAWPIPRLGCECAQCTSDDPRDQRLRASLLLDGRVLVDAGPDAYHQLRRAGAVPEAVLLTHHHHDHMLGLHDLAKLGRLPLYCTRECEKGVRRIYPRLDFRVSHLTPGVRLDLGGGLTAQAFDVEHTERTRTLGFRFTGADGASLVYLPDLAEAPSSKLARDADLLLLDGSTRTRPVKGHVPMIEGIEIARRARAGHTLFTHVGHRTGTHAELEEWLPEGIGVAYDGMDMVVAPSSSSRKLLRSSPPP